MVEITNKYKLHNMIRKDYVEHFVKFSQGKNLFFKRHNKKEIHYLTVSLQNCPILRALLKRHSRNKKYRLEKK